MSDVESPSFPSVPSREMQPRQPVLEIAQLLAAAIVRMRAKNHRTPSDVSLGFTASQSVNANPSYTEGVRG